METRPRRVKVSASTSNLGPGFDLAGLAIDRYLEVELCAAESARETQIEFGVGCEEWPRGSANLLSSAFARAAQRRDIDARRFALRVRSQIPIARGFGSSAAACVAAVMLADSLCAARATREALLSECIDIEGHPDNATPALFGGFTLSFVEGARTVVIESDVHESLGFAIAWPEAVLETEHARAILPHQVPFADAVENPRRLAALLAGMRRGDPDLLEVGSHDRLHEQHRLPLIRGGRQALDAARAAGAHAAMVSGSGSGMFAICARGHEHEIAEAMQRGFQSTGARAEGAAVQLVRTPPTVERL